MFDRILHVEINFFTNFFIKAIVLATVNCAVRETQVTRE